MIHPAHVGTVQAATVAKLNSLAQNIADEGSRSEAILKEHLKLTDKQWRKHRTEELWMSAEEAITAGIATNEGIFQPEPGASLYSIIG